MCARRVSLPLGVDVSDRPTVRNMAGNRRPDIAAEKSRMKITLGSEREMQQARDEAEPPWHLWGGERTVAQMTGRGHRAEKSERANR